ncbi:hypothetical protein [Streptococcus uberis]|uniref:hypothetical protein n=1 Tax=Streptococcus uberis TaxID=1349 RepID=UPI00193A3F31|nr:hypothetical protein [Streptococcus uberis]
MKFRINATYKELFVSKEVTSINEFNAVLVFMNEIQYLLQDGRSSIEEKIEIRVVERLEDV